MSNIPQISNTTSLIINTIDGYPFEILEANIGGLKQFVVDARPLHAFLGVGRDFSNWIKQRISKYKFIENEDFKVFANSGVNPLGGRPSAEYLITLDAAKELSMVENNDKGREARRYFIRCEKIAFEAMKAQFMQPALETRQFISPEQQDALHAIVDDRASNSGKLRAEMWTRHNRHFRIAKYSQLLAIHFDDAKNYLEKMELKTKAEKPVVPQIAIEAYEDKDVQYIMWYAPMLARLIFDDIVPALRALDSHKVGSLFSYTQEMITHVNGLNRRAKEKGIISLAHVENRLIR